MQASNVPSGVPGHADRWSLRPERTPHGDSPVKKRGNVFQQNSLCLSLGYASYRMPLKSAFCQKTGQKRQRLALTKKAGWVLPPKAPPDLGMQPSCLYTLQCCHGIGFGRRPSAQSNSNQGSMPTWLPRDSDGPKASSVAGGQKPHVGTISTPSICKCALFFFLHRTSISPKNVPFHHASLNRLVLNGEGAEACAECGGQGCDGEA
jgi:hypothetical protein